MSAEDVHGSGCDAIAVPVTGVTNRENARIAVRPHHPGLHFAQEEVSVFVLGTGTVGSHLFAHLASRQQQLHREQGLLLRLVGVADSRRARLSPEGLDPGEGRGLLAEAPPAQIERLLASLAQFPAPVLVDCTAADGMDALYLEAFARGIHVVSANKKPLVASWSGWRALRDQAHRHHRSFLYETTVGASLPVVETLKNLVRTGDEVHTIEGCFSGTLGYLCHELMLGTPLSKAVSEARRRGYTEPHPGDDLSGLDVARKALILAREIGLTLELSDVHVEPFVPSHLLVEKSVETFIDALSGYDSEVAAQIQRLKSQGKVLRYLARVDLTSDRPSLAVAPVAVDVDHPAARLRGSEAFVGFTTARYAEYPLIIQGAGAGGAVTAAGVLSDIFTVAQRARAH